MYIIIFGASKLSAYIATILSQESHGVFLIDSDQNRLDKVSGDLDVSLIHENETPWEILERLAPMKPDAVLALTDNDERNLSICKIAKNLNYQNTVALIHNENYVNATNLNFGEIFSADYFVCPSLLISQEIFKHIATKNSSGTESFAHGAIYMHTIKVPEKWDQAGKKIMDITFPEGLMLGLIRRMKTTEGSTSRKKEILFPHGKDSLEVNDEVTFVGKPEAINILNSFFNLGFKKVKSVLLVGGSKIAVNLARILEKQNIQTTLIEKNEAKSKWLSTILPKTTILNQDGTNLQYLKMEQVEKFDVVAACTYHDEINILVASLAKKLGCAKTIASIEDVNINEILAQIQIDHFVSPRETMANRILSIIQKQKVVSVSSLYENKAKILELKVSYSSPLAGIPIFELGMYLPNDFLIAAIQNRGRIMIADGNKILCPGDTVIVITHPQHYNALQKLF
ncbi:MAG: Trk system potassium uptake protein TrkA [Chlamydiae bacterium]|nr:Trk system potassium uptake protein TrkA [Chlamydiota bacterium]